MSNIDILSSIPIASLIISIVAISVSITIAKKQNKIALFDKRIDSYVKLQEYFDSPERWPKVIANKCHGQDVKNINSYVQAKEADKLFLTAELLFPEKISIKLNQIHENYKEITWRDSLIEMNLANIEHNEVVSKRILELFENNAITFITEAEREELKKICKEYEFIHYEQISAAKWEEYRCNMYELSKEQDELCEKNKRLEKEVLQEMRDVMHVNKS